MNGTLRNLFLTCVGLSLGVQLGSAQTNQLQIRTAVELEFQTDLGNSYTLQGSTDLNTWTDIGSTVLGNGQSVVRMFSTRNPGASN